MATNLAEYGIQNEGSDLRAHVCPVAQVIYTYPTADGAALIEGGKYRKAPAFQVVNGQSVQTAQGYLVPPVDIPHCKTIWIPKHVWIQYPIEREMTTTRKGEQAVHIMKWALIHGYVPIPLHGNIIHKQTVQVEGIDLVVSGQARIQVKCDFYGGEKRFHPDCTGNLYLQVAEANPLKQY